MVIEIFPTGVKKFIRSAYMNITNASDTELATNFGLNLWNSNQLWLHAQNWSFFHLYLLIANKAKFVQEMWIIHA